MHKVSSSARRVRELRAFEITIAERQKYLRDQERLINDLVETGNTQLMLLAHNITLAKQQLRELKTDIRTAIQDKVLLHEDLEQLRAEIRVVVVEAGIVPA